MLAGAGAGKTRVLCRRLRVARGGRRRTVRGGPRSTFTREAAVELRDRAEELLGRSHETLRVTTFHSYAQELTRIHGVERGLLPPVSVARQEDRMLMLLDRLDELDLRIHDLRGDVARLVEDLVKRIDACRDQLGARGRVPGLGRGGGGERGVGRRGATRRGASWSSRGSTRPTTGGWRRRGSRTSAFPSSAPSSSSGRIPTAARPPGRAARHVLVDEFQDTNHAQAELLYAVAAEGLSLMVVGDDDQGIYRFRGASAKNIVDFRRRFPEAAELRLEVNHRSGQHVLDAAAAVVEPIADRAAKRSVALPGASGPPVRFWRAPDPDGQAREVVERIVALAGEGVPLEEQAVLMRAVRLEARPVVEALERAGVPHQVRGGIGLFERREVRAAVAWLRAACDPAAVAGAPARRRRRPRTASRGRRSPTRSPPPPRRRGAVAGALDRVARAHGADGAGRGAGRGRAARPPSWGPPTRSGSRSTAPGCGPRRSRRAAPRGRRGSPGWPRWSASAARSPSASRASTPPGWRRGCRGWRRSGSAARASRRASGSASR